nr:Sua5/YciO/YrdC/YwlC family protein [Nitrospiraceae bacterium]
FECLVMTSGNLSEEPIVTDNGEAKKVLSAYADAFVFHDRDIYTRVDDSVIRADKGGNKVFIRRARGFVPAVIPLGGGGNCPEVLGAGADLKNTFTLTKGDCAIPSQHIGDMENPKTLLFYEETLEKLKGLYRVKPEAIACDMHPGYFSTRWAMRQDGVAKIPVQHHYAHIASVMAENSSLFTDGRKCIGAAFDGTGYGTDGTLWGGEFLIAGVEGFERAGHIRQFPLPGGEQAVRQPWRVALSLLREACGGNGKAAETAALIARKTGFLKTLGFRDGHLPAEVDMVIDICGKPDFSPLSSGAGRLFDAVSALLGLADINTFEAEAAMRLEALAASGIEESYPFDVVFDRPAVLDFRAAFSGIAGDIIKGRPAGLISARFHNTVACAIARAAIWLSEKTGIKDIALSGGVFQNEYLFERTAGMLAARPDCRVHVNRAVPANDGGVSLGQAYIARERLRNGH